MTDDCHICRRIARFTPDNPYLIAELASGYAVLGDHQIYHGYTVLVAKRCVSELHELSRGERTQFLEDMAVLAEAVFRAVKPRKLNYELLGNSDRHLHWHLFPRHGDDPNPTWPVWNNDALRATATSRAHVDRAVLDELRPAIQRELASLR